MEYISKKSCSIWTVCPCLVNNPKHMLKDTQNQYFKNKNGKRFTKQKKHSATNSYFSVLNLYACKVIVAFYTVFQGAFKK